MGGGTVVMAVKASPRVISQCHRVTGGLSPARTEPAGLEIDVRHFRGPRARLAGLALGLSALLALIIGIVLHAAGVVENSLLVGIILIATSLGLVIPILKDAGVADRPVGQFAIAGASLGEVSSVVLLSIFFSGRATAIGPKLLFHPKLDAIGYGFLIPVFFVTSRLTFNLSVLFSSASTLLRVPLFLLALLVVRGLPAVLYRSALASIRDVAAAGLLQATSLPFIVAATTIGLQLHAIGPANAAALVAAGLFSVIIFPSSRCSCCDRQPKARAWPRSRCTLASAGKWPRTPRPPAVTPAAHQQPPAQAPPGRAVQPLAGRPRPTCCGANVTCYGTSSLKWRDQRGTAPPVEEFEVSGEMLTHRANGSTG